MKYFELVLEDEKMMGVNAISVVESPAIEEDFIALSKEVQFAVQNEEKRIIMGAVLIPNKPIYRVDKKTGEEYYVFFTESTIRQAAELFLKKGFQGETTTEHSSSVNGVTTVEQWIIEDEVHDKTRKYGMNYPVGTWMQARKVDNDQIWQDVKAGKYNGFSIEGYFAHKPVMSVEMSMAEIEEQEAQHLVELYILGAMKGVLKNDKRVKGGLRIEMESYSDYPEAVRNNAKRGIELNEKGGNKCATQVGKIRAQQLAEGKAVSVETISRMHSYLSRAETYYDENDTEACGTISYLLWGGLAAKRWAESKLKELGKLELAEVGERGGIRKSDKAPKSDTPNKDPKGEGTAKGDASTTRGAVVTKEIEETLQNKADEFNEKYKEKLGYGANIGQLKTVFQRGVGAYNTSHSPEVTSSKQWAYARVNAFLYLVKNGRPENAKYTTDYDLLPAKHPKSDKQ